MTEVLGDDTLFVLEEGDFSVFQGRLYVDLAPMLDGSRTLPELMATVGSKYPINEFFMAMGQLAQQGCLADGSTSNEHAAFYDNFGATARADSLDHKSVAVSAVGDVDPAPLIESLRSHDLEVRDDGALRVVVVDDYLAPDLEKIDAAHHESGQPWLLTRPGGVVLWIGPLVRPGQTACWTCLAQRLRINRQVERYTEKYATALPARNSGASASPGSLLAGISLAAMEVAKALVVSESHDLANKILTLDLISHEYTEHTLIKRPQCPACGAIEIIEPEPIALQSRPKAHPGISGHRSALPEQTFARYQHHVSPITGVVTRMTPRPDRSGLINNFTAGHHFPISRDEVGQFQINRFARSGAGGKTIASAKTATLCESIERYSTVYWGDRKRIQATREQLGDDAIDLRQLQLFSDAQYANRVESNRQALNSQQFVPDLPSTTSEHSWTPAWSLTEERFKYLPTSFCFYGFQEKDSHGVSDSNGVAAGNSLEEAILSGLLELVERDAVALWWYNRCQRPAVDVASFDLPYWEKTRAYYRDKLDRELHVLDLTVDTRIPTFAVVSRRIDWPVEDVTLGFASHLDPRTALLRALGGANQYLPALEARSPDGNTSYRYVDPETLAWFKTASYQDQPYLVPDPTASPRSIQDLPSMASDDIRDDLVRCLDIVKGLGLEVLVVDQTRPDVGLPVARVAVPGLRHFWRRLAPGRLYDVPVKLGWLDRPHAESEMNPIACFV